MLTPAMHRRAHGAPAAAVLLLPSLGTSTRAWSPLLAALESDVEVWGFDAPGHGGAAPAGEDAFDLGDLAAGVIPILDELPADVPVLAVGVSMGGAVALELAARDPRIAGVAVFNSALRFGSPEGWRAIVEGARTAGSAAFDPRGTRAGWFTPAFAEGEGADAVERALRDLAAVDVDSYIACCDALARYDGRATAAAVTVPGIAVGGRVDAATPASAMRELAASQPLISYRELPGAHLAIVENAREAATLVDDLVRRVRDEPAVSAAPERKRRA